MFKKICCEAMTLTPQEQDFLLALYDGGIAAADDMVAQLITALSQSNLRDQTTIIVTSDHGEEFWEHTGRGGHHGHTLYDELLKIPLIWHEAALVTAGEKSEVPVSLIDLLPTIVSRFNLKGPERVDGLDISPLLDGLAWHPPRDLFAEGVFHGPARTSIRTPRGKLVWTPNPLLQNGEGKKYPVPVRDRVELYLPDDPGEQHDVSDDFPDLRNELMNKLRVHLDAGAKAAPSADPELMSEELKEQLRDLGYLE
jgi:arylsulfatase A-like enzyme